MNLIPIRELAGKHDGEVMRVIGRGPSIARLRAQHLPDGVIVALSYSIQPVEALSLRNVVYSLQKDFWYSDTAAPIIAHTRESLQNSPTQFETHTGAVYVFDNPLDFGLPVIAPSLVVCVYLAELMGCEAIECYCCDVMTNGETRAWREGKAETVKFPGNYQINGILAKQHADKIGIPLKWVAV